MNTKHGLYTAEMIRKRKIIRMLIKQSKNALSGFTS